ncbi:hypothetical protein ABI59_21450 [Acidobacteria bacterium Mor1]|nr:hypothetical protein ABI59_21450 [Acidobacteria bacterium Mor1]
MTRLDDIPTPFLALDRRVLQRNVEGMLRRAQRFGVVLRPHLKTAKCAEVARLAHGGSHGPITVSTLQEAAWFVERGFRDLTYAVGIVPQKLDRVAAMMRSGADLRILTDDPATAAAISEDGAGRGIRYRVMIEVDCGAGRAGLDPAGDSLLETGRALDQGEGSELCGVLTHGGQSYGCDGPAGVRVVAGTERDAAVRAAERLRAAGLPCPVVSVGSTPTAMVAENLSGVDEIRPGVYMFFDLFQHKLGMCTLEDIAIDVHTRVVGRYPERGQVLVDAGGLALSQDRSANRFDETLGYGLCLDARRTSVGRVVQVNQEHGFVELDPGRRDNPPAVGERLRILPNHACMTAAMYDRYQVTEDGIRTIGVWDRTGGW